MRLGPFFGGGDLDGAREKENGSVGSCVDSEDSGVAVPWPDSQGRQARRTHGR